MTTLREAAQQALEALELVTDLTNHDDEIYDAIDTLRAALVEDAMQKFTDVNQELEAALAETQTWVCPDSAEHRYQKPGHCEDCGKTLVQVAEPMQEGCDHCNQPLYAAIKCRVCGRETPIIEPEIKGDNKPVAWIHTDPDKRRVKFLEWRENEPGYRGDWIKTPLYAAPPQRKPLSAVDLRALYDRYAAYQEEGPEASGWWEFARAIERAHGIGGEE